ncbi:MAG TPA: ZIP family metal transporter [Candidatus Eisenbacteria bacterium]|nr:ZIP family metal transporter [Candidatus Eisenbacteria bacterium]
MNALLLSLAALCSTFAGGLFALKFRDRLHLILGFTAGVLLGVVSFDILPELFGLAAEHALDPVGPMIAMVVGFLFFHSVEKLTAIHHAQEAQYADHHHPRVGVYSALALIGHSFMDGVGIGLGFQVSTAVGAIVALAVIAHDFADGLNTVGLMLAHRNTTRRSVLMLALDALAPVVGVASTLFLEVPPAILTLYLGFFAGFLLCIGAADILPEAHSQQSSGLTIVLTCLGAAFILFVTRIMG